MLELSQIIVWLITGLLGGSIAGLIVKGGRRGFGFFQIWV